jgi:hypothetical protein
MRSISAPSTDAASRSTIGCERRQPQTTAGASGASDSASQPTTVSPSLSSPTAATRSAPTAATTSASDSSTVRTVSPASFSIHPGCGWLTWAGR